MPEAGPRVAQLTDNAAEDSKKNRRVTRAICRSPVACRRSLRANACCRMRPLTPTIIRCPTSCNAPLPGLGDGKSSDAEEKSMSVPLEMTVVEIAAPGGPEQLKVAQRPVPRPGDDEVLVRVAAAGVNRPDVMQRQGRYPPPPGASDIPGLEIAGEIVALGPEVAGVG